MSNSCDLQFGLLVATFVFIGHHSYILGGARVLKWAGTLCGLLYSCWALGLENALSLVLSLAVIVVVILKVDKKKSHHASLWLGLPYMFWFRFYNYFPVYYHNDIGSIPYVDMLTMAVTLKLVGLGFELHDDRTQGLSRSFSDAFHYIFGIVGSGAGQYVRYRTYLDSLRLPFPHHFGLKIFTRHLICSIPLIIIQRFLDPLVYCPDLYDHNITLRLLQIFFFGARFCINIWTSFTVSYLISVGFKVGAYPKECRSQTGHGPTVKYDQILEICEKEDVEYDFETISCVDAKKLLTAEFFKENVRAWNKTIQYFLFKYVYTRSFPSKSKNYRAYFTCFWSAMWHGPDIGNLLSLYVIWPTYSIFIDPIVKDILSSKIEKKSSVRCLAFFSKTFFWMTSFLFISSNSLKDHFSISDTFSHMIVLVVILMYIFEALKNIHQSKLKLF